MKSFLKKWLLSGDIASLELEKEAYKGAKAALDARLADIAKLSIVDLMRELLRGFNASEIDKSKGLAGTADILEEIKAESGEGGVSEFLKQMKEAADNKGLDRLQTFLIRNQLLYIGREAPTLLEVNFGRATINGIELERGEVGRLRTVWEERNKPPEGFDKNDVI